MLIRIFNWVKPILGAVIVIALLQATGLLSTISAFTQSGLLKSGVMDASVSIMKKPEPFDFNFKIKNQAGETINFDQYKGKVIFLNLWATWCGPCRVEMPSIQALYEKMDSSKVVFVMLSIDKDSDQPKIRTFINKYKYTFPVYQPSGYLTSQLDIPSIPTTFVINKEGKIVTKEVGATNFDTSRFRKFLTSLENE